MGSDHTVQQANGQENKAANEENRSRYQVADGDSRKCH